MRKTAALAASALLAACGGLPNIFDSGNPGGCSCTSSQVCHPITNKCVATCTSASSCPSASQSCTDLAGTSAKVCTCSSDNMCTTTEACQGWGQCAAKCTGASDCPSGYSCNSTNGRCTRPGMDAGTACTSTNQQPDNCGYGKVCQTGGACQDAQKGTCSNFSSTHSTSNWSPANATGPVIYSHIDANPDDATACTMGSAYTVTLSAYTSLTFPANESNLPGFKYVTTTGTEIDIPATLLTQGNYTVSSDMKHATMRFTLCSTTALTSIQAGFYFTGGNPYCATLTNQ